MIGFLASAGSWITGRVLFRNRVTTAISALVIVFGALFAWHKLDKRSAVRTAVSQYVAAAEIAALRSQVKEADHRARVASNARDVLARNLTAIEVQTTQAQVEIFRYAETLEGSDVCRIDPDRFKRLLTR